MYNKTTWYNGDLITALKLNNMEDGISDAVSATLIDNETDFADAINNPQAKSYFLGNFTVTSPISIADKDVVRNLTFIGGEITLNSALFTYASLTATTAPNWSIPNFVGTTFTRGTADTILATGFYPCWSSFIDCRFINVAMATASRCFQSLQFTNCYFIADADTPTFINTNAVYDLKFTQCNWENNYLPLFLNVENDDRWTGNVEIASITRNLTFVNCVSEGRVKPLVRKANGDVSFYGQYTESNSAPLMVIYGSGTFRHKTSLINCNMHSTEKTIPIIGISHSVSTELLNCEFVCVGCRIVNCLPVNTNKFLHYVVEGCAIEGADVYPSKVLSDATYEIAAGADSFNGACYTNGIAAFAKGSNTIKVRSGIKLITFMVGSSPRIVLVGKSSPAYGNVPFAYCINDPTQDFSPTYDSDTDLITLTLPSGSFQTNYNMSAIDLQTVDVKAVKDAERYRGETYAGFAPVDFKPKHSTYTE